MTAEVDWVLDQLATAVSAQPADHPLKRVDRDESQTYEGSDTVDMSTPIHERTGDLEDANFVGASFVDVSNTAIGTEYDHDREAVVAIRIEGLRHGQAFGHIDPEGVDGVRWPALKQDVREALLSGRTYPDAGRSGVTYTDLQFANEADTSSNWRDFYRYDFDVVFNGYETLP